MKNYLTVVSRDQFINLYRFGKLNIHNNFIISEEYILELLKLLQCEHDEDYLILNIKYINKYMLDKINILHNLKIQDVKSIYVLSQKAKNYYEPKFNPKIRFDIYPNLDILKQAQDYRELDDIESGINVLAKQFNFIYKDQIEEDLGKDFKNNALESLKNENYLATEYKSFYIDLLSYKREIFFPKKDIGYLFDLIVITVLRNRKPELISKFKQGNLTIDSSKTYQKLKENDNKTLLDCIKFIKNTDDEDIKKFLEKTEGIRYLIIGSLFLMIKNILLEKNTKYNEKMHEIVDIFKQDYANELAISLYLIGFVFGYKELYDDYYNHISLDIFNEKKEDNHYDSSQAYLETENQELKDKNKVLSQKLIDSENELKVYKEKECTITSEVQITSDKKDNVIGMTDVVNALATVPIVTDNVQDEKLNIDHSKVTDQKIIEEPQKLGGNPGISEIEEKTNQDSFKVFLESTDITTLHHIYYRKDTKNRKFSELKKKYTTENKDELISSILNDHKLITGGFDS